MVLKITGEDAVQKQPLFSLAESREAEYTPAYVGDQATKLHLALGEGSPGERALASSYETGTSYQYKRLLADQEILRAQTARNDVLSSIMSVDPSMVDPAMVEVAQGLSMIEMQSADLSDIVERRYAQIYTNLATAEIENDIVDEAMDENPDSALEMMDRTERVVYKQQIITSEAAKLQKEMESRSFLSKTWDFTERMVPFVEWYQKVGQVGTEEGFVSSILPGTNLEEQYSYLWNLSDPREFRTQMTAAMEDLKSRNVDVAMTWLEGLISYGSSDAVIDNLIGVAEVSSILPTATLGRALRGAAKAGNTSPKKVYEAAASLGKNDDAAVGKVVEELQNDTFFGDDVRNLKELENSVPSIAAPDKLLVGSRNVPQAAYLRLKETLSNNSELARRFILEPNLIDRATPDELLEYKDILKDEYVRQHPSIQKNVIDVEIMPTADIGNVYNAKIVIGKRDGTLFESAKQAENYFKRHINNTSDFRIVPAEGVVSKTAPKGLEHFSIEQVGQGFRIEVIKSVDESKLLSSQLRLSTTQTTPQSFANTFGGWWRSANYTVSPENVRARSTAVTSMERMKGIFEEMATPINNLNRAEMDELQDLMVTNRQSQTYYENYGDFESAFWDRFKKNPSIEQSEAYFTYVQMNDLDLVIRDLDWYKQKAVQGREEISFRLGNEDVVFEGVVVDDLPQIRNEADASFRWTVIDDKGKAKTRSSRSITDKDRETLEKLKEQGYKVIQVANQALKLGPREYTGFVITKGFGRNRVGVKNVDRKPGGHKVDTYQGYIKQGRVSRSEDGSSALYRGDLTMLGVKTQKEGEEFVALLNEARTKLLNNEQGAGRWIRDNLPIDSQKFIAQVKAGAIDLTVPFSYTPKGVRTIDTGVLSGVEGIQDLSKNIHNLDSQVMGRYAGSRDFSEIEVVRSEGDQVFEIRGAEYLDPISTLRMSAQNVVSQRAMNDYTLMTNRNFLREFGDILEGTPAQQEASGISFLLNPRFKSGADRTAAPRVAAAMNVSRAYKNLVNHGTAIDRKIAAYKDKLIGSIYPRMGPRGQAWLDERQMFGSKDPGVYLRSFAFHSKLGMFNPNQLFIQANALVNVVSIGGMAGMRGGLSYPLMRAALLTNSPENIARVAKIAESTGLMKADEFTESLQLYRRSGFNSIGKDTAFLDDVSGPEIKSKSISGAGSKILEWGTTPFREGERVVRVAAWQTAYLEKRAAIGSGKITRRDEAEMLQRAKLLSVDMTREANATWQKGYAAVFTQFFSFQARLTEQFLGKRLTKAEKARLFVGYSAMYGMPVGTGAATGILPIRDIVVDTLYGMGIDPNGSNWEPLIDGFASVLSEQITGTELNVADRYGAGGLPTLYDLFRGDTELFELLGGASGSIALQTIGDAIPMLKSVTSEIFDFEGGLYNLTTSDIILPFRNISSINSAFQLYQVYNLGVWASKNETNLMEMDVPDAVMAAITGLQPAELQDTFRRAQATRGWKEEKEAAMKELVENIRRIQKMDAGPEREKAIRMNKAEMELLWLTPQERWQVWQRGTSDELMNDNVFKKWETEVERKRMREANGG